MFQIVYTISGSNGEEPVYGIYETLEEARNHLQEAVEKAGDNIAYVSIETVPVVFDGGSRVRKQIYDTVPLGPEIQKLQDLKDYVNSVVPLDKR